MAKQIEFDFSPVVRRIGRRFNLDIPPGLKWTYTLWLWWMGIGQRNGHRISNNRMGNYRPIYDPSVVVGVRDFLADDVAEIDRLWPINDAEIEDLKSILAQSTTDQDPWHIYF